MIKTGKKEAAIGYINYFITSLSNLIILPIILNNISSEEYGLCGIFLSIQAFVSFFDLGFGS